MSKPLVTVIIPAYNHERFVEASIRSVIQQDYENIELMTALEIEHTRLFVP